VTERDALYRAILERPADDAPRLIYADWLEEHDDLERAELIRHMVHFPKDAATYRPPKSASIYWPDAPSGLIYTVRRGFAAEITVKSGFFVDGAADLFSRQPITRVSLLNRRTLDRPDGFVAVLCERPTVSHDWPLALFPGHGERTELVFKSETAAARALSDAAVAYGRSKAGLPPLI